MTSQTMGMMIASLCKAKGMTQADLAEKMGVTDKAVSKWERDLSLPDFLSIPRLAEIFDISVDELMQRKPAVKAEGNKMSLHALFSLVLKAVSLAMGVSVMVLSMQKALDVESGFFLLGLGLTCAAVCLLQKKDGM